MSPTLNLTRADKIPKTLRAPTRLCRLPAIPRPNRARLALAVPDIPRVQSPECHADHTTPWTPLSIDEVVDLLADCGLSWWIGGGWAIDLFLGRQTRHHGDTDVVVLRHELPAVRRTLAGWQLYAADPPGRLRLWPQEERLLQPVHDVWCRRSAGTPWSLQLMVIDIEDGEWVYRRNPAIRLRVAGIGAETSDGVPVLRPEIQLLFKSRAVRPKDDADFHAALPLMDASARRWLDKALSIEFPHHPWRRQL
jgi:hypothetical protein